MRYFVLREWCNIQPGTEDTYDTCVIGKATDSDRWYDGYDSADVTGGIQFDIYDSIKEAILNVKCDLKTIAFDDFTKEELAEANKVIEEALQLKSEETRSSDF